MKALTNVRVSGPSSARKVSRYQDSADLGSEYQVYNLEGCLSSTGVAQIVLHNAKTVWFLPTKPVVMSVNRSLTFSYTDPRVDFISDQCINAESVVFRLESPQSEEVKFNLIAIAQGISEVRGGDLIPLPALPNLEYVQDSLDVGTGWAQYNDTFYTTTNPFVVDEGENLFLPNNGLAGLKTNLPQGVTSFYDPVAGAITPENIGDGYLFSLSFTARASHQDAIGKVGIFIGGNQGLLFDRSFSFSVNPGEDEAFFFPISGYSAGVFIANGGKPQVEMIRGSIELFGIELQIHRIYKAAS